MTYYYNHYQPSAQTYEFTAYTEDDLLADGDTHLNCGDIFTVPATASVCITVKDDDPYLSGDCYDNAKDHSYQKAAIDEDGTEVGNGGQIYAESFYWVSDSSGKWYIMIEIEQEGSHDDYYSFYTGNGYEMPPEGAELTVHSKCNVDGNWLKYTKLDAGECAPETGSISGTVFCDTDCDGINGDIVVVPGCDYTIEAEAMSDYGFKTVEGAQASGGALAKISCLGGEGKLYTHFDGKDGTYDVTVRVQDECDGQSKLKLFVNGVFVDTIVLDQNGDGAGDDNGGFTSFKIDGVEIKDGDKIELRAYSDGGEFVRIDNIILEGQDSEEIISEPIKAGVVIKLLDLEGNVIATTVTDPDGNYAFTDVPVGDYKIMGVAPDGTEFTIQDVNGNANDDIDSDVDENGMSGVISVTADSETDIDLGVCDKPEPGSLSGRYFCDENRDGLDNDGPTGTASLGIAGVLVMLLDSAGNAAVDIDGTPIAAVETDADGNYSFGNLAAGIYSVKFTDTVSGKTLTTQNVDGDASDAIDSDAGDLGGGMSQINGIRVVAGADTPDNDAGVFPNDAPTAVADAGMTCADEELTIDLLANDSDPDGDLFSVTAISDADETVGVGGTLTLADGASVTLNADGTVTVDGEAAYASLGFGTSTVDSFSYTVEDSLGATATGAVDVTFKGYASEETIGDLVNGATVEYTVTQGATLAEFIEGYTLEITASDNPNIPLGSYTTAYCVDAIQTLEAFVPSAGTILLATEANAAAVGSLGLDASNIDSVNWLLNNDQTLVDNGDGTGDTYTDFEVQEAIWSLMNGDTFVINEFPFLEVTDNDNGVRDGLEIGTLENVAEIVQIALTQGDGFVAQDGDIFGLIIDPTSPDTQQQPFILGVEYECIC